MGAINNNMERTQVVAEDKLDDSYIPPSLLKLSKKLF